MERPVLFGLFFCSLPIKKNLLIIREGDRNIYLSGRNIKNVFVKSINDVNAYDILKAENIVFADEKMIEDVKEAVK